MNDDEISSSPASALEHKTPDEEGAAEQGSIVQHEKEPASAPTILSSSPSLTEPPVGDTSSPSSQSVPSISSTTGSESPTITQTGSPAATDTDTASATPNTSDNAATPPSSPATSSLGGTPHPQRGGATTDPSSTLAGTHASMAGPPTASSELGYPFQTTTAVAVQHSLARPRKRIPVDHDLDTMTTTTTTTNTTTTNNNRRLTASELGLRFLTGAIKKKSRKRKKNAGGGTLVGPNVLASGYSSSGSSGGSSNDGGSSEDDDEDSTKNAAGGMMKKQRGTLHKDPLSITHHHPTSTYRTPTSGGTVAAAAAASAATTASTAHSETDRTTAKDSPKRKSAMATTTTTTGGTSSTSPSSPNSATASPNRSSFEQPKGWRVKLYRLNEDGSWEDCGTGRIQCLYKPSSNETTEGGGGGERSNTDSSQGDQWLYQKTGEPTLCVQAELTKQNRQPRVLLRTRILLRDAYQRQGDNIITWCEPCFSPSSSSQHGEGLLPPSIQENSDGDGVDLALSFQDNAGCLDIWRQITQVQSRAAELSKPQNASVQRLAAAIAAQHHADLVQQEHHHQQPMGGSAASAQQGVVLSPPHHGQTPLSQQQQQSPQPGSPQQNAYRSAQLQQGPSTTDQLWAHMAEDDLHHGGPDGYHHHVMEPASAPPSLPDPPTLQNLEEVADSIAALQHVQQRDQLAMWIANDECRYLKALLELFPAAEQELDYEKLATLAACVKTVLLLNDPSIVELIVTIADLFEKICACLEYDPDLREKANHRWFLRERAKFRTVVPMNDPDLVSAIHRSFRVNYLRDTLLRPTMDESCLSSLSSMQTFSHGDIVKGVTLSPDKDDSLAESYLMRLIRTLGNELHAICVLEWMELDSHADSQVIPDYEAEDNRRDPSIVVGESSAMDGTTWKQYLAPQDASVQSRRIRRRGCISFLRELFSMVRNSLQQSDKDDFFAVVCGFRVELGDDISDNVSQNSQLVEVGSVASTIKSERLGTDASSQADFPPPLSPVTLLCLLGNVLCDPNTDATEKGGALEIIGTVAMHDASLIRRHCLEQYAERKRADEEEGFVGRPKPNESKQVVFQCPDKDLLASLIFLLDTAEDAGILLQISEIMRLLLDTDMVGDQGPPNAGFADEAEGIAPHATHGADHPNPPSASGNLQNQNGSVTTTDQKQFLAMFYESYVEWLVAPFQFQLFRCVRRVPAHISRNPHESVVMERMIATSQALIPSGDPFLRPVVVSAIRSSFAVELLSFCVRAHLYRMKFFMLKSRVLGSVLELLRRPTDRCLKLAALRFLRAILSVNDEFYHRHIIQHDLFGPVFAAFRANPVGDNLVSSAIVEMCDYITTEGINSLLEYIVTKHLSAVPEHETIPSLEDVSSPYVSTLTVLRKAYESHKQQQKEHQDSQQVFKTNHDLRTGQQTDPAGPSSLGMAGPPFFNASNAHTVNLTGEALEDQRKFRQADAEASYFESGGEGGGAGDNNSTSHEDMLHRAPRMFSFPTPAEDGEQAPSIPEDVSTNPTAIEDKSGESNSGSFYSQ